MLMIRTEKLFLLRYERMIRFERWKVLKKHMSGPGKGSDRLNVLFFDKNLS